jgi:hypothetical protein
MKRSVAIMLSGVLAVGVVAANQLGAQPTATPPASTTTTTAAPISASIATVQNIVEITRAVPAGAAAVDAFTVPAGVTLVVTDIVVTNTGTAAACGAAVNRGGSTASVTTPTTSTATRTPPMTLTQPAPSASAAGTTGTVVPGTAGAAATISAGTLTQTDSTVTGPLCVPAQTTTTLPLTTGIEFSSGQVVQLLNAPAAAGTAGGAGSLAFHLRGVLMTLI